MVTALFLAHFILLRIRKELPVASPVDTKVCNRSIYLIKKFHNALFQLEALIVQ